MERETEQEIARETSRSSDAMRAVKAEFLAMKNGIVADALRKAGSPFRLIFGLNLPQIAEIAAAHGTDTALAEELWANVTVRESMLLAPMLVDTASFTPADARRWCDAVNCTEVADVLCHRLLRHLPFAAVLARQLLETGNVTDEYTGLRLFLNISRTCPQAAEAAARTHIGSSDRRNALLAADIIDRVCPNA